MALGASKVEKEKAMNKTLGKLYIAVGLALALGAGNAADAATQPAKINAAAHGRVMVLGTIQVTAADAEGVKHAHRYGSTMYLGTVQVTPADSDAARAAAREARETGAVYLGDIRVTAEDSADARAAASYAAATPHTAYLGSVRVKPSKLQAPVLAGASLGRLAVLKIISTLAFGRAGG
jgi:hypothetical protein